MAVTAQAVMELRQKTGRPMMECKKALMSSDGDMEKAILELRKSGQKAIEKLADRTAKDGAVAWYRSEDGRTGALVALCCETDPVTRNELFIGFREALLKLVSEHGPADTGALKALPLEGGTVEDVRTELIEKIRENITIGGFARFEGDAVGLYVHHDGKLGAMVALTGKPLTEETEALGKDISMHIAMFKPAFRAREDVPAEEVTREKAFLVDRLKEDPKNASKPEEILGKIVEGQIGKFFADRCLLEQPFIKDDKKTVGEVLKAHGVELTKFALISTAG